MAGEDRGEWKSRLGFILAASGSAIGLGNIVFFPANAYRFGGGAFYLPYFLALFLIGIPIMILEFGLGHSTRRAFPSALNKVAGRRGEFIGWWAIFNASYITMYYIAIVGWVMGMMIGSLGDLWKASVALPAFGMAEGELPNPWAFFFNMLSTWRPVLFVVVVWLINILIVRQGTKSIERTVRVCVPMMWLFMIVLIVRGITLPHGEEGVFLLFSPNFEVMGQVEVWRGAFGQIFFTLSLGFGIMCAYASYLPKRSDQVANAYTTSFLNCGFEYIAGLAIFSLLFAFAMVPKASTLSMMFFIVPAGISKLPGGPVAVSTFGIMFFLLLLLAGITSSVSLLEALVAAVLDKFKRGRVLTVSIFATVGCLGSILFALPQVVNPGLEDNGTMGLNLLDLVDHWAFSHGLLLVGIGECIFVGWVYGAHKLRKQINRYTAINLHPAWDWLVKLVIPALLTFVLVMSVRQEITDGLYGTSYAANYSPDWKDRLGPLPYVVLILWFAVATTLAVVMTMARGTPEEDARKEVE